MPATRLGMAEDLATLSTLDEKILLDELKTRYEQDKIYTYVGDILVAVNPYCDLNIYGRDAIARYQTVRRGQHPPHVFAVADAAYQAMMGMGGYPPQNQCILISGESGAGKTETTKLIIKQIVEISRGNTQLEQQIVQMNPLLEAFGNAQTLMNDNSSRFGRYIQLKFSKGAVVGAKISEYLLEKSRVVRQNQGEENFHIFYYMFAGFSPAEQQRYRLNKPNKNRYFSDGGACLKNSAQKLKERYDELVNAMDMVGFSAQEQEDMFTILVSVLAIGNIDVDSNEHGESTISDAQGAAKTTAELLGINVQELTGCLTSHVTFTSGEQIRRNYSKFQAEDSRDAAAKTIYGRLFSWIVNKINSILAPNVEDPRKLDEIGILDIFGFEHFEKNSFEQACINLANEQLQFFFNKHIFHLEQKEYVKEGIDWTEIKFADNQPILNLFLGRPIGLFSLLDEESHFPQGTDCSFVDKLMSRFDKEPHFIKSPQSRTVNFTIKHYAGKVMYSADGWLDKNRDTLPPGVMPMLQQANNKLLGLIFKGKISRTGTLSLQHRTTKRTTQQETLRLVKEAKERRLTVGAQFKNSLEVLMEKMMTSRPVFIRCIKPNQVKAPRNFENDYVNRQLLYTGMLETTKIRRDGFAIRPTFTEFTEKYQILIHRHRLEPTADNCRQILNVSKMKGWFVGKTKVFLKYFHVDQLGALLEDLGRQAIHMQRVVRGFCARRRVARMRKKAAEEKVEMERLLLQIQDLSDSATDQQNKAIKNDASIPKKYFDEIDGGKMATAISSEYYMERADSKGESSGDEILEDIFTVQQKKPPLMTSTSTNTSMAKKHASVRWFQDTQIQRVQTPSGEFADWFHGIISRRESERLLTHKPIGCFLIRVSESRFGYTLSFTTPTRCRHYMIDQLPSGKYVIVGEPKVHKTLHAMVEFHSKQCLSNYPGLLTVPCGQEEGNCNYVDLISTQLGVSASAPDEVTPTSLPPLPPRVKPRINSTAWDGTIVQPTAPPWPDQLLESDGIASPPPIPERHNYSLEQRTQDSTHRHRQPPPVPRNKPKLYPDIYNEAELRQKSSMASSTSGNPPVPKKRISATRARKFPA